MHLKDVFAFAFSQGNKFLTMPAKIEGQKLKEKRSEEVIKMSVRNEVGESTETLSAAFFFTYLIHLKFPIRNH
mgnify:FL=1